MTDSSFRVLTLAAVLSASLAAQAQSGNSPTSTLRPGDQIAAVVNQDVVAASEVVARTEKLREEAKRRGEAMPDPELLKKQALEALIEDRVLITHARDSGARVDEPELDRTVNNVAAQNKISLDELKVRLKAEGMDYKRFRETLRDQMLTERVREREVQGRIKITDGDVDKYLEDQAAKAAANPPVNIAQVLIGIPDGAAEAVVAEKRALADKALARVLAGEDFSKVAKDMSEDSNHENGGEIGMRSTDKLPDMFVDAVRDLKAGEVRKTVLRSAAGFHVLKLIEREVPRAANQLVQTHARHILLRPSPQLAPEVAGRRLAEMKRAIEAGTITFEEAARQNSEDGSAPQGGDLGWVAQGGFVPEFEEAMNALPLKGISEPFASRFGLHLVQVLERRTIELDAKQMREQARIALRETKYAQAYDEWVKDLRAKAFVEMREWNL